jgi:L-asparaginase/Glu-tRNA(Gln) amidotransferase subunit D
VRPARGAILRSTYAFAGAESDLRATPVICAGALSPAAARIKLMACLGAGYTRVSTAGAFAADDA